MEKKTGIKSNLHARNRHNTSYDFDKLVVASPDLKQYVSKNKYGNLSIDFFNPKAVVALNKALLKGHYAIDFWEIPEGYLCPPIPGRADYIHNIADVLAESNQGKIPKGKKVKCLDIGVGAACIFPILGNAEYGWSFIGSDISSEALNSALKIAESNPALGNNIQLRLQLNTRNVFHGIIQNTETIDVTVCNPPFHSSAAEANAGTLRKLNNLKNKRVKTPTLNFGGNNNELWCIGGEKQFIRTMIQQSKDLALSCLWFTTLVSKKTNLDPIYNSIKKVGAKEIKTIEMQQGNKSSRMVCWSFLNKEEQLQWAKSKW